MLQLSTKYLYGRQKWGRRQSCPSCLGILLKFLSVFILSSFFLVYVFILSCKIVLVDRAIQIQRGRVKCLHRAVLQQHECQWECPSGVSLGLAAGFWRHVGNRRDRKGFEYGPWWLILCHWSWQVFPLTALCVCVHLNVWEKDTFSNRYLQIYSCFVLVHWPKITIWEA